MHLSPTSKLGYLSFKRGGLSTVEIATFMFKSTLISGLSREVSLSSGWPHKSHVTLHFNIRTLMLTGQNRPSLVLFIDLASC